MQNILVAGCSFTEQCGFTKQNQPLYHWPYLLADYYKSNITNIGINAGSCEEVFYRTLEQVINQSYIYHLYNHNINLKMLNRLFYIKIMFK